MIERDTNIISRFITVLSIIIFFDVMNIIMNLYTNVNDNIGLNVVDMIFVIKFIALISLFITLVRWSSNRDNNLLKRQVVIHTIYVLGITMFYFLILYLFKYSIILNAMDILRNKMIDGNPALLLNFAIYTYNTLKFVRGAYSGFNSEFILMIEIVILIWHLRNVMTLKEKEEEPKKFDDFLYTGNVRVVAFSLVVLSFISINLFEYTFDYLDAVMFFVSSFLFTIQIPISYLVNKINSLGRNETRASHLKAMYDLIFVLTLITLIGFALYVAIQVYAMAQGIFTYRFYSTVIALGVTAYLFNFIRRNKALIV